MFFAVSKTLGYLLLPSNFILGVGFLGVVLMATRWRRAGRRLAALSLILLALAGLTPLGDWLIAPLEDRFPPWDAARGAPDGIVVLGGAITPDVSLARGAVALNESAERLTAAVELARRYPQTRIVYSGGNARLLGDGGDESQVAATLLNALGVAPERLVLENHSRNTLENASFTRALVDVRPGQRWLLVTSAYHMPRAVGAFRQAGFEVEPYPVDWRTRGTSEPALPFESLAAGLRRTDTAAREWIGLLAYRLNGRSAALFPAP